MTADIVGTGDAGCFIHAGQCVSHPDGEHLSRRAGCSPLLYPESIMQQNETMTTAPSTPAPELFPFSDLFPRTSPLELMLLEHSVIKAAATLCEDYRRDQWWCRKISDKIAYAVPTRADTYTVKVDITHFEGEVSADTFGLIVTLSVLGYLTALMKRDEEAARFCDLREYALQHPQTQSIRAALGLKGA
ncbi:Putative Antirestriction plasmid protein (modular protein) [Xenorhabdus poinarii G6]|uniref:Putative Antirestriction plasmid protein (Modular protein) n=1 Tax=Xenorhabdus poinarii G6 TaxID=1354304 RepID=A0A068R5N7_9GAMM|nr:antirestriction protein [Xenorhabdus poinarii]CDG22211.1 Putative Antirestriction plasmid protein (modular protein) [Xenorhabdus poinarii G6]